MNKDWPTRETDMQTAYQLIEDFANKNNTDTLGLFELFVDLKEKKMDFRLSSWVMILSEYFKSLYGAMQGEFVTRQVVTNCLTSGHTIH